MYNNNFSPFPFFRSKAEQTKWYAYGRDYVYLCPKGGILPFQIQRGHSTEYGKGDEITTYTTINGYGISNYALVEAKAQAGQVNSIAKISIADIGDESVLYVEDLPNGYFVNKSGESVNGYSIGIGSGDTIHQMEHPYPSYSGNFTGAIGIDDSDEYVWARLKISSQASALSAKFYKGVTTIRQIKSAIIKNAETDEEIASIDVAEFSIVNSGNYDYIVCNGILGAFEGNGATKMYIELTDGLNTFYSAYFGWSNPCLSIEWYDKQDLKFRDGIISYANGYHNKMYFDAELGMPEYEFEEEVTERNGYSYPLSQISYKKYKFNILAPEAVCDVMRLIRLSDVVIVKAEGIRYWASSFLITPEWQEQGYLANVACEFTTDTMVKKNGKGYALSRGDYNEDYNDDYNNVK